MKENRCKTAPGRAQKCHESQEIRQRATEEDIPLPRQSSKWSGPEESDIFPQSVPHD